MVINVEYPLNIEWKTNLMGKTEYSPFWSLADLGYRIADALCLVA